MPHRAAADRPLAEGAGTGRAQAHTRPRGARRTPRSSRRRGCARRPKQSSRCSVTTRSGGRHRSRNSWATFEARTRAGSTYRSASAVLEAARVVELQPRVVAESQLEHAWDGFDGVDLARRDRYLSAASSTFATAIPIVTPFSVGCMWSPPRWRCRARRARSAPLLGGSACPSDHRRSSGTRPRARRGRTSRRTCTRTCRSRPPSTGTAAGTSNARTPASSRASNAPSLT